MNYKISLSELRAASSFNENGNLQTESGNALTLQNSIQSFVANKKTLIGAGWESVFNSLSQYDEALAKRFEIAGSIFVAIRVALNKLIEYIGDYEVLDTSKAEEIANNIKDCEKIISSLEDAIARKKTINVYDEETGDIKSSYEVDYYSDSEKEEFSERIKKIRQIIDNDLQPLLDKINGLESVYLEAEGILAEAFSGLDDFENYVNGLQPHSIM